MDFETSYRYAAKALTLTAEEFATLDCLRLIYWSAKARGDKATQRTALNDLLALRPEETLWLRERQSLSTP